jgi:ADP-dependent NAD(P)H-hydrate dehydratase / NAD(P)H-hydrate epimerase
VVRQHQLRRRFLFPYKAQERSVTPQRDVYGIAQVGLPTGQQSAAADRLARESLGVPERVLMENAGRAAAMVVHALWPAGSIVGVAGSGNNGGDLLVMLRVLQAWGREVTLVEAGSRPPDALLAHGFAVPVAAGDAEADTAVQRAAVIVDGMLGTGSSGAPRGRIGEWIRRVNAARAPVLALDLPSGVDPTTGVVVGDAVSADVTVAFGWPKLGLMLNPARAHCGRLIAVEIGFPPACALHDAVAITPEWVRLHLRPRAPTAHKSSAGRLAILAGSIGMAGAAAIAGEAAVRAGAGLVRIASPAGNREVLQRLVPEATFLDRDHLAPDDLASIHALLAGPGMGTEPAAFAALSRALELTGERPVILDADGLNMLAQQDAGMLRRTSDSRPVVITPHALELSRLTGESVDDITRDPVGAARGAASRFGCVVLLKGQPTLIAAPEGQVLVNTTGSSDLATAGMGDQLAGTIAALLAGGHDALDAAAVGLFIAGRAADLCGLGRSLAPRDVSARLADAFVEPGLRSSSLGLPFITFDQPPRW